MGQGRFGKVWLAHDLLVGRFVAIKEIRDPRSIEASRQMELLWHKAGLLGSVSHPNLVTLYACRVVDDQLFLIQQFVKGSSLDDRLKSSGKLIWKVAASYVADIGDALLHLHQKGIIHRDVKPANILWNSDSDEVLLTDLGVGARLQSDSIAGTPIYMPPEAMRGIVTPSADVYGLAATLYVLLTNNMPFSCSGIELIQEKTKWTMPITPHESEIPQEIATAIAKGLKPNVDERPSLAEFVRSIRSSLNNFLVTSMSLDIGSSSPSGGLTMIVSRYDEKSGYSPIANAVFDKKLAERATRDIRRVSEHSTRAVFETGDKIRIEAKTGRAGHLTVFNVDRKSQLALPANYRR